MLLLGEIGVMEIKVTSQEFLDPQMMDQPGLILLPVAFPLISRGFFLIFLSLIIKLHISSSKSPISLQMHGIFGNIPMSPEMDQVPVEIG